jgi:poly(A) polymerase
MLELTKKIQLIHPFLDKGEEYYLVGGAVRDSILGRENKDLDIVCSGDTRGIARKVADATHGSFFVLDDARNTCRVITETSFGDRIVYDFVQMRTSIINDLSERDFTINAMAIDLRKLDYVIDPLKGGRDLQEKWLRPCSPTSFLKDSVRVIRAVRYSVNLKLKMEKSTQSLLAEAAGETNCSRSLKMIARISRCDCLNHLVFFLI